MLEEDTPENQKHRGTGLSQGSVWAESFAARTFPNQAPSEEGLLTTDCTLPPGLSAVPLLQGPGLQGPD